MINTHIKNILEENHRENSADSDVRSLNYYLEKLNDEDRTTVGESKSDQHHDANA